ncbi:MAG: hypothetical protein AAGG48_14480 [Planctomycetota bacterium]
MKSMGGLATAAAGLAGVASIGNEIRKSFANIDNLAKTSDKLGIATEKLTALRFAAEESGVSASTTDMALQRMVRRIAEAAQGSGEAVGALQELGLSAERLAMLAPDEQFAALADAMSEVSGQGDRVRLSMKLFDSEGVSLVNTLRLGSKGLAEYQREAEKLGLTVSRFDAQQVEKANDALGRVAKSIEGISNQVAIRLAPLVEGVAKSFAKWSSSSDIASRDIREDLMGIAKAIGFVRDGIEFWIRSFKSVRAIISEFFAWYLKTAEQANRQFVDMINKGMIRPLSEFLELASLKTIDIDMELKPSKFVATFASTMEGAAKEARKKADEAWAAPLPSEGIKEFFSNMGDNIEKSRKEFNAITDQKSVANGLIMDIGKGASAIAGDIKSMASNVAETITASINRASPEILDANTAEGFAQLRSSVTNSGNIQEKLLQEQKKETTATEAVVSAIDNLAASMMPSEMVGFDS